MAEGFRDLLRTPYSTVLLLHLLILGASASVGDRSDGTALLGALLLEVVSTYLLIAMTLAAASKRDRSADEWIKLSFRRKVFWRYTLTGLVVVVVILVGLVVLIVGGLMLGAVFALAFPVSIQERAWPPTALRRSAALSEGNRVPLGVVFAVLFVLPFSVVIAGGQLGWDEDLGAAWLALGGLGTVTTLAGVIALTRAYIALGGTLTEPEF